MKKPRTKMMVRLFFGLLLVSAILVAIPFFLNPDSLKRIALSHIQHTFGPYITIGQTNLSLFPIPRVEFTNVIAKEGPDTHAFFRVKRLSLDFGVGQLLRQNIVFNKLSLDRPEIELTRERQGKWSMGRSRENSSDVSFLGNLFFVPQIRITQGQITIIDESRSESIRGVSLNDVNFSLLSSEENGYHAQIEWSGRIRRAGKSSDFLLKGQIERALIEPTLAQIRPQPSLPRMKFAGRMKVQNLDLFQMATLFQVRLDPLKDMSLVDIQGGIRLIPSPMGYELHLSELLLKNEMVVLSGNATISGLMEKDPTLSINFSSSPISVRDLQRYSSSEGLSEGMKDLLAQAEVGGSIEVVQATVAGSTRRDVGFSVNGEFLLREGYFRMTEAWPLTEEIQGTIVVEPDRIRFVDFTGMYDSIPVTSAQGTVLFKESGPWMEIELRGHVPGKRVLGVVSQIAGWKKTHPPLSSLSVIEGSGSLLLRYTGLVSMEEGYLHGLKFTRGEYVAQGIRVHLPGLRHPIWDGKGRVRFSPTETELVNVSGRLGNGTFRLNGSILTKEVAVFRRFRLQAQVESEEILKAWVPGWPANQVVKGPIAINAIMSGPVGTPRVKGEVDLIESVLRIPKVLEKDKGVAGTLEFEVRLPRVGPLILDRLDILILPIRLTGRGLVTFTPVLSIKVSLNTGPIYLGLLPEGLRIGGEELHSGILEVSVDINGGGYDWQNWNTHGWIALTEGVVTSEGLDAPMTNLFLRLKVHGDSVELKRLDFRIQNSEAHLSGFIRNWKAKPDITLSVDTSNFDIDLLIPKEKRSPLRELLETLAAHTSVVGTVSFDRPIYKQLTLKTLSCEVRIRDGLISFNRIKGNSEGSELEGRVFIHLPEEKPAAVRASFDVKGLPFEDLQQSVGHENRLVTGLFSVRGKIQGHGRDSRGVIPTLEGKIDVTIEQGHVRRGTILPRILALLNLPLVLQGKVDLDVEGFPFNKASSVLLIKDGVVTAEDFVVDSPIMKMTVAGHYNLAEDNLDVVAAVSPFGRYSAFMKTIPLFGRILAGERKGIATALFQVEGSLEDPEVTYLPFQSLTTGLKGLAQLAIDILVNTLMLPVNLLNSNGEKGSQETIPGHYEEDSSMESTVLVPP